MIKKTTQELIEKAVPFLSPLMTNGSPGPFEKVVEVHLQVGQTQEEAEDKKKPKTSLEPSHFPFFLYLWWTSESDPEYGQNEFEVVWEHSLNDEPWQDLPSPPSGDADPSDRDDLYEVPGGDPGKHQYRARVKRKDAGDVFHTTNVCTVWVVEVTGLDTDPPGKNAALKNKKVTFEVTAHPQDHYGGIVWKVDGIEEDVGGKTFKWSWNSLGTKTVTATCCGSSASKTIEIIADLTVVPKKAYVPVGGTKEFEAWKRSGNVAENVTAQSTFYTSRDNSMTGNTLTASSTPSPPEGGDYVRAVHNTTSTEDTGGDCDLTVFDMEILQPSNGEEFELSQNNYTKTPNVTFKARVLPEYAGGTINWTLDLSWNPSFERSGFIAQRTFTSNSNDTHTEVYEAEGGELKVKAYATVHGANSEEKTITVYVKGHSIPNPTICSRLKNLYDPDSELTETEKNKLADLNWTDGICFGIACKEAFPPPGGPQQFFSGNVANYPVTRMPLVSDDDGSGAYGDNNDGSHVGLMQVETDKAQAWNWLTNTADGVALYQSKMHLALAYWQKVKDIHSDATKWTAHQLEDCTSGHYRFGGNIENPSDWYLIWDDVDKEWDVTTNTTLKNYVDGVRGYAC